MYWLVLYIDKAESTIKNEIFEILRDFDKQTNQLILAGRLVIVAIYKKLFSRFWCSSKLWGKNKRKRNARLIARSCQRLEKALKLDAWLW